MKNAFRLSTILIASALAACGGGGSGSTATTQPAATSPAPQAGNLVMTMPSSTYPTASASAAFAEINTTRLAGGYGAATQNMQLDQAATAHVGYFFRKWFTIPIEQVDQDFRVLRDAAGNVLYWLSLNPQAVTADPANGGTLRAHLETPGDPGFTGVTVTDRAAATGYGFAAGEVIGLDLRNGRGTCAQGLLSTVYHRQILLDPAVGELGIGTITDPTAAQFPCVVDVSRGSVARVVPDGWTGVYPGVGQTDVAPKLAGEVPSPASEYAVIGQAVSIFLTPGHTIGVSKFSLTPAGGASMPGKVLTKPTDPNGIYLSTSHAAFVPNGALLAATTYTASFEGTDKAPAGTTVAVSKTWTFTTK